MGRKPLFGERPKHSRSPSAVACLAGDRSAAAPVISTKGGPPGGCQTEVLALRKSLTMDSDQSNHSGPQPFGWESEVTPGTSQDWDTTGIYKVQLYKVQPETAAKIVPAEPVAETTLAVPAAKIFPHQSNRTHRRLT